MFSGKLIKKNGKLTYAGPQDKLAYDIPKLVIRDVNVLKLFITTVKSCLAEN